MCEGIDSFAGESKHLLDVQEDQPSNLRGLRKMFVRRGDKVGVEAIETVGSCTTKFWGNTRCGMTTSSLSTWDWLDDLVEDVTCTQCRKVSDKLSGKSACDD